MQISAVLNQLSTAFMANNTNVSAPIIPEAITLIGTPTTCIFGETIDLQNERMQYNFLVYQKYNAVDGITGMVNTLGTSGWINIPHVSQESPNINISVKSTSVILESDLVFTVNAIISYSEIRPELCNVAIEN